VNTKLLTSVSNVVVFKSEVVIIIVVFKSEVVVFIIIIIIIVIVVVIVESARTGRGRGLVSFFIARALPFIASSLMRVARSVGRKKGCEDSRDDENRYPFGTLLTLAFGFGHEGAVLGVVIARTAVTRNRAAADRHGYNDKADNQPPSPSESAVELPSITDRSDQSAGASLPCLIQPTVRHAPPSAAVADPLAKAPSRQTLLILDPPIGCR